MKALLFLPDSLPLRSLRPSACHTVVPLPNRDECGFKNGFGNFTHE